MPNCLQDSSAVKSINVLTFFDASKDACGMVCLFFCTVYISDLVRVVFIASKANVAPLALTSIPRLELSAAIGGLRVTSSIVNIRGLSMS